MTDEPINPIGFANFAKSYADSAEYLIDGINTKELNVRFHAPVDFLLAHALELNLKALYLKCGKSDEDVRNFGHDIAKLYQDAKRGSCSAPVIKHLEHHVRIFWKTTLRRARDVHREKVEGYLHSIDKNNEEEFGIYDNETIGRELPELWPSIHWFSELHLSDGSEFRYLKTGLKQRLEIRVFGLEVDVHNVTALQVCKIFHSHFRNSK
ncbi:hypothetical protein [uncultured Roseobacter sp.]|uniref:hypothetical protein n=1 Tax=uncultured Roseobacter sp. TaxID=114847 RepID=UPI00260848A5|nr:hypothetical protein [uncultured Roseobacter sp.]